MFNFNEEENLFALGHELVGGLDEAGRGPLAGPVVAACVVCRRGDGVDPELLAAVKDSKKLTGKKREELFGLINERVYEVGIGICDHATIDRINILQASFLAMKKALGALKNKPGHIIVDGKFVLPNFSRPQKAVINGDNKVFSVAAASIIAKVTRDRIMLELHAQYPLYGFDRHKGYGTAFHLEQLRAHGPCPIHRKTFAPVKLVTHNS